jgi:hypothetical protein
VIVLDAAEDAARGGEYRALVPTDVVAQLPALLRGVGELELAPFEPAVEVVPGSSTFTVGAPHQSRVEVTAI